MIRPIAGMVFLASLASTSLGQTRFVIADRTLDSLWLLDDEDRNGVIDEPGEVRLFFSGANAAGTLGPANPTSLAIFDNGRVAYGDQQNRNIYALYDANRDKDAQDSGESLVAADAANASAVSFAFPTGAGFDAAGRVYIVNAGNSFGNDGLYQLLDLTDDGDSQDEGEIINYVTTGAFGPGNGPYSPQEFLITESGVGFLRNSSSGLHGVYRFVDADSSGRADDTGEWTVFWDASGASGVTPSAGFALEPDRARPGALYVQQTATGGVDQIVRIADQTGDDDAQDAGEATLVYSTGESGFTLIDMVCLRNGDLLITDNSGSRVYRLHDGDGDGLFSAEERSVFFANSLALVGDIRQIAIFPRIGDLNCDDLVNFDDIDAFVAALISRAAHAELHPGCPWLHGDVNADNVVNFDDIDGFVELLVTGG